jgi:hypothetical protein
MIPRMSRRGERAWLLKAWLQLSSLNESRENLVIHKMESSSIEI